jgi:hypothetical protein
MAWLVGDDPIAANLVARRLRCKTGGGDDGRVVRSKEGAAWTPRPRPTLTLARSTALCSAVLAVVVAVPIALAAALPGAARYAGETDDGSPVTLRLTSDARYVKRMRIHYTVACDNGRSGDTYTDILQVRVHKDHRFSGAGTYQGSGDGSENTFKVSGRLSARRASGRFSLTATGTPADGSDPVHCKTGVLRWHAARAR